LKTDFKTDWELGARVLGYAFLFRSLLEEPSTAFFEGIKKDDLLVFFPYIEEDQDIKEGVGFIDAYLTQNKPIEDLSEELAIEYFRLFIGADKAIAPPWESVYLSGRGLLFQENTLAVRKKYSKYKLLPERLNKEPDDHIGLELQFMHTLSMMTLEAVESSDYNKAAALISDQKSFLEDHLLKWAPRFADRLYAGAETFFYQGLAKMLKGFLMVDHDKIIELSKMIDKEKEGSS